MRTASRAVAFATALVLASSCARAPEEAPPRSAAEPRIRLSLGPPGPGAVDVEGLLPEDLAELQRADLTRDQWTALLRVQVAADGAPPPDRPAVLGTHAVADGMLRFVPQFPFEPGTRYDVEFDPSLLSSSDEGQAPASRGRPIKATVRVPTRQAHPATRVVEVYPTADLPENQLRLYIVFSAPMSLLSGAPHVQLIDADGKAVVDPFLPLDVDLWNEDRTRFTLLFDPGRVKRGILPNEQMGRSLVAGRTYTLVVDAEWRDANGAPLVAPYRREFRVRPSQEEAIDPAGWRLELPPGGTRDPLTVSFPQPLDYGLLQRTLSVSSEGGRWLAGTAHVDRGETRWRFTPRDSWQPGTYRLVAASILEDVAGNRIGRPFEVAFLDNHAAKRQAVGASVTFQVGSRQSTVHGRQ
jgi:hypothetical protein